MQGFVAEIQGFIAEIHSFQSRRVLCIYTRAVLQVLGRFSWVAVFLSQGNRALCRERSKCGLFCRSYRVLLRNVQGSFAERSSFWMVCYTAASVWLHISAKYSRKKIPVPSKIQAGIVKVLCESEEFVRAPQTPLVRAPCEESETRL